MPLLPYSHFSTDDLPAKDRLASWREDISVIFDHEPAPIADPHPFRVVFDLYHFGHSVLARLDASPGRYVRSTHKVSKDGMDSVLLQLFLEGGVQFGVGQRTTYAEAGDIVVFDMAQPVDNFNRRFQHITVMWPRPALEAVVPDIERWHGLCLPRENPSVALLRQHMIASYELARQLTPREGLRIEEATLALVGAAMGGVHAVKETVVPPAMTEVLIFQIKRHIRQNLAAADQSPEQIARHFGISRRHLYQLLEPVGGIARYQRQLRLQRCLADLRNPEYANLQISEIAYRWGFRSATTFNRNFRGAFGITPTGARNCPQGGHPAALSPTEARRREAHRQAEHQQWFMALGI
ncbi:MAG: helix-turn-helix domain-containing protein [Opitutales bacterium]|nr:helix-turn-helix domain-containing protein [Opitutales bacterium]